MIDMKANSSQRDAFKLFYRRKNLALLLSSQRKIPYDEALKIAKTKILSRRELSEYIFLAWLYQNHLSSESLTEDQMKAVVNSLRAIGIG
jgi:hypothetical protein